MRWATRMCPCPQTSRVWVNTINISRTFQLRGSSPGTSVHHTPSGFNFWPPVRATRLASLSRCNRIWAFSCFALWAGDEDVRLWSTDPVQSQFNSRCDLWEPSLWQLHPVVMLLQVGTTIKTQTPTCFTYYTKALNKWDIHLLRVYKELYYRFLQKKILYVTKMDY